MTIVYKLTTQDNKTRKGYSNECTWGPGVTHSGTGKGELCGPGFIHAYLSPELAVLFNPIHANIQNPNLWECETEIVKTDRGLKVGGISLKTVRKIKLPSVTNEQRVIFGILCGRAVFGGKSDVWDKWAADYIAGKNRKDKDCAANAAHAAAYAAYAANVAHAAHAVAYAAYAAAYAAHAAANVANAAHAAHAAAYAAYAARSAVGLDLVELARQALRMK